MCRWADANSESFVEAQIEALCRKNVKRQKSISRDVQRQLTHLYTQRWKFIVRGQRLRMLRRGLDVERNFTRMVRNSECTDHNWVCGWNKATEGDKTSAGGDTDQSMKTG